MKWFLFFTTTCLLLFFLPFWSGGGRGGHLFAQSVQVDNLKANYENKTVTFRVHWAAGSRNATHLNKVWVFVDYQPVTGITRKGLWQRATLAGLPSASHGVPSFDGSTQQGFWLEAPAGNDGFSSEVSVPLGNVPSKFNWCAFATDYPPNATMQDGGSYTLKGSAPFLVTLGSGSTIRLSGTTYSGDCIAEITDRTQCPGLVENIALDPGTVSGATTVTQGTIPTTGATTTTPTGGSGTYYYQWYKGGNQVPGATEPGFMPPADDALSTGTFTYTRQVADNLCEKDYRLSAGSFMMIVVQACVPAGSVRDLGHCCDGLGYHRRTKTCSKYGTHCPTKVQAGRLFNEMVITCNGKKLLVQTSDASISSYQGGQNTCWAPDHLCPKGWRWPSYGELECLYIQQATIGSFDKGSGYWSNEYASSSYAYGMDFKDRRELAHDTSVSHKVRCVKSL
jgi:hypothetical protein